MRAVVYRLRRIEPRVRLLQCAGVHTGVLGHALHRHYHGYHYPAACRTVSSLRWGQPLTRILVAFTPGFVFAKIGRPSRQKRNIMFSELAVVNNQERYWYGNPDRLSEGYYVQGGAPCFVLRFSNTRHNLPPAWPMARPLTAELQAEPGVRATLSAVDAATRAGARR